MRVDLVKMRTISSMENARFEWSDGPPVDMGFTSIKLWNLQHRLPKNQQEFSSPRGGDRPSADPRSLASPLPLDYTDGAAGVASLS